MSDLDQLSEHLRGVFAAAADAEQPGFAERREGFVFHMLDWQDDLKRLAELYAAPERRSADEARAIVQAFLYHAASHIVAAARLGGFFLDAFGTPSA